MNPPTPALLRRIRIVTILFMAGLVISGITAIPLVSGIDWLVQVTGVSQAGNGQAPESGWAAWLLRVSAALHEMDRAHPFLFYGTDWLAFAHVVIAIAFIGAVRDPVQNEWLFVFGLIACALIPPWALILGRLRSVPFWWQLIDCGFGVLGAVPLWLCLRWTRQLSDRETKRS